MISLSTKATTESPTRQPCTALIREDPPTFLNQFTIYMIFGFKFVKTLQPHELWPKIPNPMFRVRDWLGLEHVPSYQRHEILDPKPYLGCKLKWISACIYDRRPEMNYPAIFPSSLVSLIQAKNRNHQPWTSNHDPMIQLTLVQTIDKHDRFKKISPPNGS